MDPVVLGSWPKALHVERGGTARLREFVERSGKRGFVICGKTVANGPIMNRLRSGLGTSLAGVFDGVLQHTPLSTVRAASTAFIESGADVIVSVGGGSATDTGKAVAIHASAGCLYPFRIDAAVKRDGARANLPSTTTPHIAVPTIPGAGNVLLPTAGVLDEQTRRKMLFDDAMLVPALSVLDAELLAYCGPSLTAITAIRSIVGSVEALYAKRRNPFTTSLALDAIRMMRIALPTSLQLPEDIDARERSMYAAILGTLATMNAGVSAVHAAGLVLGARYNVAHGIPHAILLPPVMRAFAAALEPVSADLERAFGVAAGEDAVQAFERLSSSAGLPMRLRAIGIPKEDFNQIVAQTATLPIMNFTPRAVATNEIREWLEASW